jgi:hypothetical protein
MRHIFLAMLLCALAVGCGAAKPQEGRWEGPLDIPGRDLRLVVDLAQDKSGAWAGSIIIPGLGIKGEPASHLVVTDSDIAFDVAGALASPSGPAGFKAHLTAGGDLAGEMKQGGNVAKFELQRVGAAQVEYAPRSTQVARDIEDAWTGDIELGGYPRHITITLENHGEAAATAKFVVVGKQTTDLPVDLVVEEGSFLRVESQAARISFEGRFVKEKGEIRGVFEMGSFELPLVLRRVSGRAS